MNDQLFLGIDVGTGSARAGVFDSTGRIRAAASTEIHTWRPQTDLVEQSSPDIWRACCNSVHTALAKNRIDPARIAGIGFDATCSLVVLNADGRPVTVSPSGNDRQNVIVWMDHRAVEQAERINALGHDVLKYVGSRISPEMQTPKLLWLKEHLPETWKRAAMFLDLPDFLTWRATGSDVRSLCSTVCKWTYLGHESATEPNSIGRWDGSYFQSIGLGELEDEQFAHRPARAADGRGDRRRFVGSGGG